MAGPATGTSGADDRPASRFVAFLEHRQLPLRLALLATLLTAPTLAIGFHLDDYVHRYLLSDMEGGAALLRAYESPFGIANGERDVNHWQIEKGYAPWWTDEHLLISLYRPISELAHRLDAALWPDDAVLQHAHSLLWHFGLIAVATLLYRRVMGPGTLAGAAALFYAVDHTHGFAVGWIANRNALIAAFFGVLALLAHHQARASGVRASAAAAPALLLAALLSGEGSIAVVGYLVAYALFLDRGSLRARALSLLPHLLIVVGWRAVYNALGRGAHGSGLYLDPVQEPLTFALAVFERAPLLLLGELALPPAEASLFLPPPWPPLILALAVLVTLLLGLTALPLLRRDATARFWAAGMLMALVPACTTHPNNRLLFFVGLGAMGLLSQLWHGMLEQAAWLPSGAAWRALARGFTALVTGFHLLVSPLLLPVTACSVAFTSEARRAADSALESLEPHAGATAATDAELVVVSSPDYFHVKLIPVIAALEQRPAPARLRALAFGSTDLRITREDAHSLRVRYAGGVLADPLLELYRARETPMPVGSRVQLRGMTVEVTVAQDGVPTEALFRFARVLEDARLRWLSWDGERYRAWKPPALGETRAVAGHGVRFGL